MTSPNMAGVTRTRRTLVCCCLVQVLLVMPAWGKSSRKTREDAAKKACAVGDVSKGIDLLGELYIETNDPVFVHNQARCYQQNGLWEKSLNRFEEYLRKATDLSADDRRAVEKYISECQAKLDKTAPPPAPVQPIQIIPTPPTVETVQTPPQTPPPAPSPVAEDPGQGMRVGGIVTAAAGLAAVGVGIGFNLAERNLHNQMASDASKNTTDNENRRSTYQAISIIGYSVGAAALVTGTVLYLLGTRQNTTPDDRISLAAEFAEGKVSLGVKGGF